MGENGKNDKNSKNKKKILALGKNFYCRKVFSFLVSFLFQKIKFKTCPKKYYKMNPFLFLGLCHGILIY